MCLVVFVTGCLCVWVFVFLDVCVSGCLCVCMVVFVTGCLCVLMFVCLGVCMSGCLCVSGCLCACMSGCLCICIGLWLPSMSDL